MVQAVTRWFLGSSFAFGFSLLAVASCVRAEDSRGEWNQWRGPNRDGISTEKGLLNSWPEQGPAIAYSVNGLGTGMASIAIADGKIFTMGNKDGNTRVVCLDQQNGEIIWSTPFTQAKSDPNCSPTVDLASGLVFALSNDGVLVCCKVDGGQVVWQTSFTQHLGGKIESSWGYSVGHGIVSYDAKTGTLLWNYDRVANTTANIPTPIAKDNYIFCSTGYDDGGTALLEISKSGKKLEAKEVYYKTSQELQNHHGGMIMIGDYVYMGHGHNNGFPACVEWKTDKNLWEKARGPGSGSAAIVAAEGKLYFRYQDGTMALINATKGRYDLISKFKLPTHNGESWPHPVIAGGKLFIRDQDELVCFTIGK